MAGNNQKKKKKTESKKDSGNQQSAETSAPNPNTDSKPAEDANQPDEQAFSAAGVVFFTRDSSEAVDKVLLAVEERKVSASFMGLDKKGKITTKVMIFPMGRREKKDKSDAVETARREYVEETGDFGGLARFLDFADFSGGDSFEELKKANVKNVDYMWTGRKNFALHFNPASLIVLFCEVPAKVTADEHHAAEGGISKDADEQPKKRRKAEQLKSSPTYHVGTCDHLTPVWVESSTLKEVLNTSDRAPVLHVIQQEVQLFPTAASVLRLPAAREWLGLPTASKQLTVTDTSSA